MIWSENHTTIMKLDYRGGGLLYYYRGNFYHPLDLPGKYIGIVKKAIREFTKENKSFIEADRSHPDYKTLLQIFDEHIEGITNASRN